MRRRITFKLIEDKEEESYHRYEIVELENILPSKVISVSIPRLDKSEKMHLQLFVTNILEEEEIEALSRESQIEMIFTK